MVTRKQKVKLGCFLRWYGGSAYARSSLQAPGILHLLPDPPAPSSKNKTKTKMKGQGEELNIKASWRGMGSGEVVTVPMPKSKKKGMANRYTQLSTKFKLDFCLRPEVMGSNSLVSNPCQGCSDPSPILANASLAVAGSGTLAALVFPAPSSGWMGLLLTSLPSLPPNQLVLSRSTFYLKAEGWSFLCPGRLLLASWTLLPHAATRWRAGASQTGPGRPRLCSLQSAP